MQRHLEYHNAVFFNSVCMMSSAEIETGRSRLALLLYLKNSDCIDLDVDSLHRAWKEGL